MERIQKPETEPSVDRKAPLTLAGHIRYASFGQGAVVFELDTRQSHSLNHTAAIVIDLALRGHTVDSIVGRLALENPAGAEQTGTDVNRFLGDMINRGWIDGR